MAGASFVGAYLPLGATCVPDFNVRKYNTSCQRCNSGKLLNDGIPRSGFPLVIFQNKAPSVSFCTNAEE